MQHYLDGGFPLTSLTTAERVTPLHTLPELREEHTEVPCLAYAKERDDVCERKR